MSTVVEDDIQAATAEGTSFRQVGRHVLIYGLGLLLSRAVSFLMLPVYTRFLTPADYGVMELIQMTLDIISIAAGAQLALGMFRYYHKTEDVREKNAVVSTALVALSLSYFLVGGATFIAATRLSHLVFGTAEYAGLIRIASVSLAFQSLLTVPLAYARLRDRSMLYVSANAVRLLISLSLNLVFLIPLQMGVRGIFISTLISHVVVGLWLVTIVLRDVGLRFSREATRNLLRYGVPLIGMHIANFIMTFSDRYFLQSHGGSTAVGLYTLAYSFGFLLGMVGYMPIESVWEPKRFEVARRPDRDQVYARAFIYLNLLLITAAVGLALFAGDLVRFMAAPAFHGAADLIPVILLAYLFQGWTGMQNLGILMKERTELITLAAWIGAGTALLSFWFLVPRYQGWGAAIGAVLAFAVRYALVYAWSQKVWRVEYRWAPVLRLLAAGIGVSVLGQLLPPMSLLASIAVHALLFSAYAVLAWNLRVIEPWEKQRFVNIVRSALSMRPDVIRAALSG